MSIERRIRRSSGRRIAWGVVELHQRLEGDMEVWTAFWAELGGRGRVSVEADFAERANNICRDAWLRARQGLGAPPSHIVVLDERTARRVRAAVPASVPVVVDAGRRELRAYVDSWQRAAGEIENTHSFFN